MPVRTFGGHTKLKGPMTLIRGQILTGRKAVTANQPTIRVPVPPEKLVDGDEPNYDGWGKEYPGNY